MTEIASSDKMVVRPPCQWCAKEIYAIAKVFHTIGVERPIHLHRSCYVEMAKKIMGDK